MYGNVRKGIGLGLHGGMTLWFFGVNKGVDESVNWWFEHFEGWLREYTIMKGGVWKFFIGLTTKKWIDSLND